jgi:hypothetical protein
MTTDYELLKIADKMVAEYDRLETLDRDIEAGDWVTYDALHEQLWNTPARSIEGVIAKARILDQRLRIDGEPHSVLDSGRAWHIINDLLAFEGAVMSAQLERIGKTPEDLDRPPEGWFVLDVMKKESRKWDWVALMIDVDPEDLKNCTCEGSAFLYVHPKDCRPGDRVAHQRWVRIPGKHRNIESAWDAFLNMMH